MEENSINMICGTCINYNQTWKYCKIHHDSKNRTHGHRTVKHSDHCIMWRQKKNSCNIGMYAITDYISNAEEINKHKPFFYDKNNIFWLWNNELAKWEISDEIDLLNILNDELQFLGQVIIGKVRTNYINAFKNVGRKHIPLPVPKNYVQFKDTVFNIDNGEQFNTTPEYLWCNPIPWKIGKDTNTPQIDKLLTEWVGDKNKQILYQIIAYCCYTDYPLHLIFCLVGCGRNGKSKFLNLLRKFIGDNNICSTELDMVSESRFESFKLFKKTACILGETNFGTLRKTSLLKKLTGQDLVSMEMKGKQPFDAENYAKILIASNSLPSSDDTSEGFYRRWLIVDFRNTFEEGCDVLQNIPEWEYEALAKKVVVLLPELLKRGYFDGQGSIEQRKNAYIMASNPLPDFIKNHCVIGFDKWTSYNAFYQAYVDYLLHNKKRKVSRKEFKEALSNEGFYPTNTTKYDSEGNKMTGWWVDCVCLK